MSLMGTKAAAQLLGVRPGTLTRAVWEDRLQAPAKAPGGAFVWTVEDLRRASLALLHRPFNDSAAAGQAGGA